MVTPTMPENKTSVALVMLPLPLHGHMNQLLHLSRHVSNHNIPVHFVCTTTHTLQAMLRTHGWDPHSNPNIHFHNLPPPPFASPPPNPHSPTKFPSHLQPLCDAATQLRRPVTALLRKLSPTTARLVVLHDSLMASVVQDFVTLPNAESYTFHSVSAFSIALYTSEKVRKQIERLIEPHTLTNDLLSFEGCFTAEFENFIAIQHEYTKLSSGRIYNTCRIVEQPVLELLEREDRSRNKLLWALGPFNPVDIKRSTNDDGPVEKCLRWLDKQEPSSVILVSFGTTTSFTKEQVVEIAVGLEKSDHKFVWVLRDADKGDTLKDDQLVELPRGYEDRVKRRGMVVREWAPQLEILGHRATGGFMSHCGWNSCMESISMGVPIAAWPIHSDQPSNAVLVTGVLKVGLMVKEWCRRNAVVEAATVEKAVKGLMGSEEGDEMRRRAMEMGRRVRKSARDGGTQAELQSFVNHIIRKNCK